MNNTILLYFMLPGGQHYLPIWVHPEWPIFDVAHYIYQLGYLPDHEAGYGLHVRNQWILSNYTIAQLALVHEETIQIVALQPQPKHNHTISPQFGQGGKYSMLMNAIKEAQHTAPIAKYGAAPASNSNSSVLDWLKKLLS